jgi:hypothetical protein
MSTYKLIKKRVENSSLEKITKLLEYSSFQKAEKIVNKFLSSKDLYSWLDSGYYDFKYTPKLFLQKLCQVFQFNYKDIEEELRKQSIYYDEVKRVQKNYIFVNTNFRRKNEPIFLLACLEQTRQISLNTRDVVFKNKEKTLEIVIKQIQQHYKKNNGKLNIWGNIVNYVYYHENEIFIFDRDGTRIESQKIKRSRAILTVKGKKLC